MPAGRICTVKQLKDALHIDGDGDDAELARRIEEASDFIERKTNRTFKEVEDVTEFHSTRGGILMWTRKRPVTATTAFDLRLDTKIPRAFGSETALVLDRDFVVDLDLGKVELIGFTSFPTAPKSLRVTYSAGYVHGMIPRAVQEACIHLAAFFHQRYTSSQSLITSSIGMDQGQTTIIEDIPGPVLALIQPFTFPAIGIES